uniref:Thioredoxin domain-containing protein n=1 Tax=Arcella intermedia TaxID=1963864 RepID=A0A6B2LC23_9EUKA
MVDIWAEWCGPCVKVGPTIAKLGEVLSKVPGIGIGKLNCDNNTVNKKYFPESGIPNIKFFPKGKKDQPIKYNGDRSLTSFIEFIHQNATVKFDLQKYKIVAETSEMMRKVDKLVGEVEGRIPPESRVEMDKLLNAIRAELEKTGVDAEILLKQVAFWEQAPFLAQLNKLKNKNVIHVTSHPEYLALIEKAKVENKLLVVDFFATWCGPCVQLAPLFADWSEEFMDVVFAKVDVDLLRESATFENIQCMPTIKFYKKELLNTIEGFDIEEIRNNIHQNK